MVFTRQRNQSLSQITLSARAADSGLIEITNQHLGQQFPHRFIFPETYFSDFLPDTIDDFKRRTDRCRPLLLAQFSVFTTLLENEAHKRHLHSGVEVRKIVPI